MRFGLLVSAILAGTMLLTVDANAQLSREWRSCTGNPDVDWDQQIRSCTALIQSVRETTHNRAIAYYNRGLAYRAKGDNDRAIADYSEAIRLRPKYMYAYFSRGLANLYAGALPNALADLNQASALDPKYAYDFDEWFAANAELKALGAAP